MAQSGFTPIKLYLSTTAAAVPLAADLAPGELAINNNDGKLFYEDSSGVVQVIATKAGASGDVVGPASATNTAVPTFDGTTGKLIQNNSGVTIAANVVTATGFTGALNGTLGATTPATVVATQVDITAQGDLRLQDSTGGEYVALQAPATIAASYTLTLPVDDGTAGQALITDGSGVLSWSTAASGDVYGPASATDNAVARFDGTTGKIIQNSAVTIADDGATVIAANSASDGLRITQIGAGNALVVEDSSNPDATPFVVAADGTVIRGYTSPVVTDNYVGTQGTPLIQTHANATTASGLASFVWESSAVSPAPSVILSRSRSATIGSFSSVASGDAIGAINFNGDDGTAFVVGASILASVDGTPGTGDMPGRLVFSTTADGASSPTERMRISSSGAIGIGTALTQVNLYNTRNLSGNVTSYGNYLQATVQSDVTASAIGYRSALSTVASAFTLSSLYGFYSGQGTIGAGSTVTNQFGFVADSSLTGATNNYGFYSDIASGTGRYNFYANGTADNYFAGNVGVGTTTMSQKLNVTGVNSTGFAGQRIQNNNANIGIAGFELSSDTTYAKAAIGLLRQNANGNGALVFYNDSNADAADWSTGDERMRIASTGTISLGAAPGSESLRVAPVASAVNHVQVVGAATGNTPTISTQGSDTNVDLALTQKGTGGLATYSSGQSVTSISTTTLGGSFGIFDTGAAAGNGGSLVFGAATGVWRFAAIKSFVTNGASNTQGDLYFLTRRNATDATLTSAAQIAANGVISLGSAAGSESLRVTPVASAVNYLNALGAATGANVSFAANGSDTNISIAYTSKGNGSQLFYSNNYGSLNFAVAHTASAVNYLQVTGGATTAGVNFSAKGSDANIFITYDTKGTEAHSFRTNAGAQQQFRIAHTASAVNYLQATGAATGGTPVLFAMGSDTNVSLVMTSQAAGNVQLRTGTGGQIQFLASHTASAVNYLQATGGATTAGVTLSAQGSDTNIDLALTPKGTGVLAFGTYTAGIIAQAGYITIKDAGGTTRRLLVG